MLSAQLGTGGVCGTPPVDMDVLRQSKAMAKTMDLESKMTTYIPLRFKLIGRSDGTGAADVNRVLDLVRSMNVDFAPMGWQFYLENGNGEPWDYYFNTDFYTNHAQQERLLRTFRSTNAVSIYVPNTATPANSAGLGVTLGYYSPSLDILVFRRSEVGSNASTASHEVGHYFSLPHTFRGWDCCSWDGLTTEDCSNPEITSPVMQLTAPCSNRAVELVTRGSGANCATAGDTFCDTNADYNLGFGWNNCNYTGGVRDRNNDLLTPDEDNFMGYFLDCNPYQFSDEQQAAMIGNRNLSSRSFLRGGAPDFTDTIAEAISYVFPTEEDATIDIADQVTIDWAPVPFAQYYYIEVSERRSFSTIFLQELITDGSTEITLTGLDADTKYYYRMRAFSQVSFGAVESTRSITTGTISSADQLGEAVNTLALGPNPVTAGSDLNITIQSDFDQQATANVIDLTGRTLQTQQVRLSNGTSRIVLPIERSLAAGTYVLSLTSDRGVTNRKFTVNK